MNNEIRNALYGCNWRKKKIKKNIKIANSQNVQCFTLATCLIIWKSLKWVAHFLSFFFLRCFFFVNAIQYVGISPTYILSEIICYYIIIFGAVVVVYFSFARCIEMKQCRCHIIYSRSIFSGINKGINLFRIQMKTVHKLFRVHFWIEIDILWLCWMWFASDYLWQNFEWKTRQTYRISYCCVYTYIFGIAFNNNIRTDTNSLRMEMDAMPCHAHNRWSSSLQFRCTLFDVFNWHNMNRGL